MDIMQLIQDLNYPAIIVATIVCLALGALWYSPAMFVQAWLEDLRINPNQSQKKMNMPLIHALSFVSMFSVNWVLAMILESSATLASAVNTSLFFAVFVVVAASVKHYLYEGKPCRVFLINSGYEIVCLVLSGLIIGAWK